MNCPACDSKRLHAPSDWEYHPYVHHGCSDGTWTHPDLPCRHKRIMPSGICLDCGKRAAIQMQQPSSAGAASLGQISGEVSAVKTAPAGGKE